MKTAFTKLTSNAREIANRLSADRGDVPGWVLITLMTAGLVVLMWTAAGPALKGIFDQAMTKVVAF
jgi:hypothetical protein